MAPLGVFHHRAIETGMLLSHRSPDFVSSQPWVSWTLCISTSCQNDWGHFPWHGGPLRHSHCSVPWWSGIKGRTGISSDFFALLSQPLSLLMMESKCEEIRKMDGRNYHTGLPCWVFVEGEGTCTAAGCARSRGSLKYAGTRTN